MPIQLLSDWSSEVNDIREITKDLSLSTFVSASAHVGASKTVRGNRMGRVEEDATKLALVLGIGVRPHDVRTRAYCCQNFHFGIAKRSAALDDPPTHEGA